MSVATLMTCWCDLTRLQALYVQLLVLANTDSLEVCKHAIGLNLEQALKLEVYIQILSIFRDLSSDTYHAS